MIEYSFILVESEDERNVGAVARALKTMGHQDLRLVNPRCDHLSEGCLLYTSPSPRDLSTSRMPSSA